MTENPTPATGAPRASRIPAEAARGGVKPQRNRHAAGADPAKRDQILDGAAHVFLEKGFDAASMNDICRVAGVSKSTLYVYFTDKEDLFAALAAQKRDRLFAGVEQLLEADVPLERKLFTFGQRLAGVTCSDEVIRAQRIIVGIVQRMPELGARFYETVAARTQNSLRHLLEREVAAGRLKIADVPLAVHQFAVLTTAGTWRPRLFGQIDAAPAPEEIDATVESAVSMFLSAYAATGRDRAG